MHNRSLSRELSLLSLGLIKDKGDLELNKLQIDQIFESALDSLINYCRDELDDCEADLENVSQNLLDIELKEGSNSSLGNIRDEFKKAFHKIESVMNLGPQPTIDPLSPSSVEVHLINREIMVHKAKKV